MFIDVIGVMEAAGEYPLPPSTGHYFVYPGPRSHDGILIEDAPADEADKTFERVYNFLYHNFFFPSTSLGISRHRLGMGWKNVHPADK